MTAARREVLAAVAALLPASGRIAVDGIDGAGKTCFADELAELAGAERSVLRVRLDDFLNPREVRYRRGRSSPDGYWADSFDHDRFRTALPSGAAITIADGVFLQRRELVDLWTLVIFLEVPFDTAARRLADRDGLPADPEHPRMRRYTDAQRRYLTEFAPRERADVLIDNTDLAAPVILRARR
jgi:uridine kinase